MKQAKEYIRLHGCGDLVIISLNNKLLITWQVYIWFLQLFSSYMYAYAAAFRLHPGISKDIWGLTWFFEMSFLVDIIRMLFTEYPKFGSSGHTATIRDFHMIVKNYFNTRAIHDIVPIIPLQAIVLENNRQYLFFLIKIYRLIDAMDKMNVS